MKTRLLKGMVMLVFVVASLVVGPTAFAQSPFAPSQNPIDAVVARLDQIIEMLTPGTPVAGPVTLSTGFAYVGVSARALCSLANVGTAAITNVDIKAKTNFGITVASRHLDSLPPSGLPVGDLLADPAGVEPIYRCEFSFVGFAKDVRGAIGIVSFTGQPLLSLDAR